MRSIDLRKLDELSILTEELEVVVYLQSLVKYDIVTKCFTEFEDTADIADDYLLKLNLLTVEKLKKLIGGEDFTSKKLL